jgi:hypothetical protein
VSRPRRSTRLPRHLTPGRRRLAPAGGALDLLLLARGPREWVGVDLASGAYVRFTHPGADAPAGARPGRSALRLTLGEPEPLDPARPEAVALNGEPELLPPPRRRSTRLCVRPCRRRR